MDIESISVEEATALLGRVGEGDDSAKNLLESLAPADRLKLVRLVVTSDKVAQSKVINSPNDLAKNDGVLRLDLLKHLKNFGEDKGAYMIQLLKQNLGRSPTMADIAGHILDDAINIVSDPRVQELLSTGKAESFGLSSQDDD